MENPPVANNSKSSIIKQYYKADYYSLFNKIRDIKTPVKSDILKAMLDGAWHSERTLVRIAKKSQYMGAVTLGTMVNSLNNLLSNSYVEKKFHDGEMYYKISDNYVGLTRAAYNKYRQR